MQQVRFQRLNKLGLAVAGVLLAACLIWCAAFYAGFQSGKILTTHQIKNAIEKDQVVQLAKDQYAIGILADWPWEPLRVQFMTPYKIAIFDMRGQPTIVDWQPGPIPEREGTNERKENPDAKKNEPKR